MKIIVTYASAGAGHFKAAEAVYKYLKECCPAADTKLVDVLKKANPVFGYGYKLSYYFLIKYALFLWQFLFWLTELKALQPLSRAIVSFVDGINTTNFAKFLTQENPDFIISTHFLSSEIASFIKNNRKIKSTIITIITDFGAHPFWISEGTDIYIVASEFTKRELMANGVKEDCIKELGIPIDTKFLQLNDRHALCNRLNIDESKFTVLIMTGSFGVGPLEKIVKTLHKKVQILVVCANNKKLYKRLKSMNLVDVAIFGFIDNVQELMAASDMIITKPGGISISEILAMELVPIFIAAIPGQEQINAKILSSYGIGFLPKNIREIKNIVLDFRDHPNRLMSIKENMRKIKKPFALGEIGNVICQGSAGHTC